MQNEAQIPEIWETEEDKKLTIKQLKDKFKRYAYSCFIRKPSLIVMNQTTRWNIEITTRIIKEWWNKSRTRPRIISIQLLDKMIETAILVKTEIDIKNTPGIEKVYEFENKCKIEDQLYKIRIIIKKQPERYFAYYYSAIEQ